MTAIIQNLIPVLVSFQFCSMKLMLFRSIEMFFCVYFKSVFDFITYVRTFMSKSQVSADFFICIMLWNVIIHMDLAIIQDKNVHLLRGYHLPCKFVHSNKSLLVIVKKGECETLK